MPRGDKSKYRADKADRGGKKKGAAASLSMWLVAIALVVLAAGLVLALMDLRARDLQVQTAMSASTNAASVYAAPTPVRVPIQAAANVRAATAPAYRPCTANDITGTASWLVGSDSIAGTLEITDSSKSGCSLAHSDSFQISSANRTLAVAQVATGNEGDHTDLAPGQAVPMRFVWSNWCGGALGAPAYVRLILPDNAGYLRVPVIAPTGEAQSDAPRCDFPNVYSTVRIWQ